MEKNDKKQIDMSSEAIDRRLKQWSQLYQLGVSLQKTAKLTDTDEKKATKN